MPTTPKGLRRFACVLSAMLLLTGCSGVTPAQSAAAAKLAADCKRNVADPELEFIAVDGGTVSLKMSDETRKKLRAATAQDITAGNISKLDTSAWALMIGVLADTKCLAEKSGTPTDANGSPKAGDWPNWKVTMDADGLPTFTSTAK